MTPKDQKLVKQWVSNQTKGTPLLASVIAHELHEEVNPGDVAAALGRLSSQGVISPVFVVRVPSGVVLRKLYRSPDEIEQEVRDQFNRVVPRDDLEVLRAFARVQ